MAYIDKIKVGGVDYDIQDTSLKSAFDEDHTGLSSLFNYVTKYNYLVESGNMIYPKFCFETGIWFYNGTRYKYNQGNDSTKKSRAYIVPVEENHNYKNVCYNVSDGSQTNLKCLYANYYDKDFNFISTSANVTNLTSPANAAFLIIQMPVLSNVGDVSDAYLPYLCDGAESLPNLFSGFAGITLKEIYQKLSKLPSDIFNLPVYYRTIRGDTFELFWKGVILLNDFDRYYLKATCDVGAVYKDRFIFTPTANDSGWHTIYIDLYDYYGELVASSSTQLGIASKKSSTSTKVVLCVGDSLTVDGEWPHELKRRITGTGGSPAGDGLVNVKFIGTCEKNGTNYEGYGGWTFASYNQASKSNKFLWITTNTEKTANDQHSLYKDANDNTWILETIETGRMKIICQNASNPTMLTSGTLTYISGGESTTNIVYTDAEQAAGNPFWNTSTNSVDFDSYASQQNVSSIDYCYVLLGWNNMATARETIKTNAQTFITNLHNDFPNCVIVLMGLEIPSLDGLGRNYGASKSYMDLSRFVKTIDTINKELQDANTNVYAVNTSGQFDTVHNMQTGTRTVNTRNPQTETYQTNGIHPGLYGYLQIADVAYRDISARF